MIIQKRDKPTKDAIRYENTARLYQKLAEILNIGFNRKGKHFRLPAPRLVILNKAINHIKLLTKVLNHSPSLDSLTTQPNIIPSQNKHPKNSQSLKPKNQPLDDQNKSIIRKRPALKESNIINKHFSLNFKIPQTTVEQRKNIQRSVKRSQEKTAYRKLRSLLPKPKKSKTFLKTIRSSTSYITSMIDLLSK